MNLASVTLIVSLVALGGASLPGKVMQTPAPLAEAGAPSSAEYPASAESPAAAELEAAGWTFAGRLDLTLNGVYSVDAYASPACDGLIALRKTPESGEAEHMFRQAAGPGGGLFYHLGEGPLVSELPYLRTYLMAKAGSVLRRVGMAGSVGWQPPVSVIVTAQCWDAAREVWPDLPVQPDWQ